LNMFVLEYLHTKYPKMPTKMLQDVVATYTRTDTLSLMGKEFGVEDVARWVRSKVRKTRRIQSCRQLKASMTAPNSASFLFFNR